MAAMAVPMNKLDDDDANDTDTLLHKSKSSQTDKNKNKTKDPDQEKQQQQQQSFGKWLLHKPWAKLPFLYFLVGILGVPALAVFYFMDADTAYLACCGYIALNIFGLKHFYTLIGLKKQVDDFGALNKKFSGEQKKLSQQVDKLNMANASLRDSANRIKRANAQNRENLNQFANLQETMKNLNVQTTDELKNIQARANRIGDNWQAQLIEHERDMLHTVFDRYEAASGKAGMTIKEFKEFSKELPETYQKRFARLGTFEKISHDGIHLNFSDFDAALDLFAEMEALDVDIEFTIEKTAADGNGESVENDQYDKPVLEVEEMKDEEFGDISMMKRWTTKRKRYNDNIKRKIVVTKRVFRSRKAKEFTTDLGFTARESDASSEDEHSAGDFGKSDLSGTDGEGSPSPAPVGWHQDASMKSVKMQRDMTMSFLSTPDPDDDESETEQLINKRFGGK